jgi:hypothetical protein
MATHHNVRARSASATLERVFLRGTFLRHVREAADLEHLPQLDSGPASAAWKLGDRHALRALDRFVARHDLNHPIAGDQILRLGEWSVGDDGLAASSLSLLNSWSNGPGADRRPEYDKDA